jgi:hypothetical protein
MLLSHVNPLFKRHKYLKFETYDQDHLYKFLKTQ